LSYKALMPLVAVAVLLATPALATPGDATVTIGNFTFGPMAVTVPAGATVTWVNEDDVPHTVRAIDGAFHSRALDTDEKFSFTFNTPGVYSYFCSLHPKMTAKVIVRRP
jgi:plastocyanin